MHGPSRQCRQSDAIEVKQDWRKKHDQNPFKNEECEQGERGIENKWTSLIYLGRVTYFELGLQSRTSEQCTDTTVEKAVTLRKREKGPEKRIVHPFYISHK